MELGGGVSHGAVGGAPNGAPKCHYGAFADGGGALLAIFCSPKYVCHAQ